MDDSGTLRQKIASIDGKGYKAYRELRGRYVFPRFTLFLDYIQGDPFAAPSRLRAAVSQPLAGFDPSLYRTPARRVALEDYLARAFDRAVGACVRGRRGTGGSGRVSVDAGGQEIIERTAAVVSDAAVEVRFRAGLPADGRRCRGRDAAAMLLEEIPAVVDRSLYFVALDEQELKRHVEAAEDQDSLRAQLPALGLAAFIGDGAVLPRRSGVSDEPLTGASEGQGDSQEAKHVVRFQSPPELRVEVELPNRGRVTGMGIPEGVTLIVGGGYHGKSTLLSAIERGVYSHVPGDGRELAVARQDAVKIRAEDGRCVERVDIDPFISNLPLGTDTRSFSTPNASGSTSQATNIIEALEAGSRLLLIDEDTSATNFMIRDELMQRLISKEKEPITPFIDQAQNLRREHGVSTILVMGGSGDYFPIADTVIAMEDYLPRVVTDQAKEIVASTKELRINEAGHQFGPLAARAPRADSIDPYRGDRQKVSAQGRGRLKFGTSTIELASVEQLVDTSQTQAVGEMLAYGRRRGYFNGETPLAEVLDKLFGDIARLGLDIIAPMYGDEAIAALDAGRFVDPGARLHPGELALPRRYEVAATLNRLRGLEVKQIP